MNKNRHEFGILKPIKVWTQPQVDALTTRLRNNALEYVDCVMTFGWLDKLVSNIDLIATKVPVLERPTLLAGQDGELSKLYTQVIGAWRLVGISFPETFPNYHLGVTTRINGIQLIKKDGGRRLLQAIADYSTEKMSREARAAYGKVRQGEGAKSKTRRLFMLIEEQRRFTHKWDEVMTAIIKKLNLQSAAPEDSNDPEILGNLIETRHDKGMAGLKQHGHTVYHGYKKTKDYERWLTTEEYELWKSRGEFIFSTPHG